MQRTCAWSLALLVPLLASTATAAYDVGSSVTADDPVLMNGRGSAQLLSGIAAVLGAQKDGTSLSLVADELWLDYLSQPGMCTPQFPPLDDCDGAGSPTTDAGHVRGARVEVTQTGAYKVLVTNDPAYFSEIPGGGAIVATLGRDSKLTGTDAAQFLTPYDEGWTAEGQAREPLYQVDTRVPVVEGPGNAALKASGNFETLLQGFRVKITGTDADTGAPYDKTFDTKAPSADGVAFLVIEASEGTLNAVSPTRIGAYAVSVIELEDGGKVKLTGAEGRVSTDGDAKQLAGEPVTLDGPIALSEITIQDGSPMKIAFAITSAPPTDEPNDVQQIAVAAAAGAGGAGLLAAGVYFWPRLKYAAMLGVLPLYTRIERTQVLDHAKRDEIYELIRGAPGIHAHEIGEKTQIGWGTTVYHLKMLESHSLVVSKKSGRYKRFYVNTGEYTKKKDVYAALRNPTAKNVADYINQNPGTSQKDLCAALAIQPSLASWHVDKLEAVGLVKRVKDGRQVRYFAGPAWSDLTPTPPGGANDRPAEA